MASTLLDHARRGIETIQYMTISGAILCDWTLAPILSAAKVNQDSFLIDRTKS
jgi:hypothetical protein